MLPVLAGLLLGGLIVVACWDDIVNWLKDLIPKVKAALSGIAHAVKMFGKKVKNAAVHIIHRLFYKEQGKWIEETTKREVPESEVPDWALESISQQETDISEGIKEELEMSLS